MTDTLVVLLGPTAVGKTELSIRLAKLLSCDIISADSRQIYKQIDIGTAKPTKEEQQEVRHHFIDILPLDQYYSAAQYEADALRLIASQSAAHPCQLMVGGSMMYIDAVTKGIDDIPTIEDETRQLMHHKFETEGLDALCAELRLLDPEYYDLVDKKNHKRIVHALEICYQTGRTYTSFRKNQTKDRPFRIIKIGLRRERDNLFARINRRVDQMMQQGLMDEARHLYPLRHLNSLNTVGYKELFKVLDGEWELPMAVERIKKNTRVYAKKQMTWFAHDADIHWIDVDKLTIEQQIQQIRALLE
ncbi:MAG: tRNA (adenosine(37)-N6)-dimethylallyltransferase MiaA [Bacteroidaceae bacterium]|nr:tRNA (adenosine(37)-N6)-dimethylallyltransferase MiaA [Bacteroidaceae bacterium]